MMPQLGSGSINYLHRRIGGQGLVEAGADIFVMPSRFEHCGLNQFYSQRYGTPPIVHNTGGLADSVVDCTPGTLKVGTASGLSFDGMTMENLYETIRRAVDLFGDKRKWKSLCRNCMIKDFSWETSARRPSRLSEGAGQERVG